jgi:hypothetical protein
MAYEAMFTTVRWKERQRPGWDRERKRKKRGEDGVWVLWEVVDMEYETSGVTGAWKFVLNWKSISMIRQYILF